MVIKGQHMSLLLPAFGKPFQLYFMRIDGITARLTVPVRLKLKQMLCGQTNADEQCMNTVSFNKACGVRTFLFCFSSFSLLASRLPFCHSTLLFPSLSHQNMPRA